jgi:hypothetical protein
MPSNHLRPRMLTSSSPMLVTCSEVLISSFLLLKAHEASTTTQIKDSSLTSAQGNSQIVLKWL